MPTATSATRIRNRTEFDWGDEHKPEVLTEAAKQALNERIGTLTQLINETLSAISSYTGPTHART